MTAFEPTWPEGPPTCDLEHPARMILRDRQERVLFDTSEQMAWREPGPGPEYSTIFMFSGPVLRSGYAVTATLSVPALDWGLIMPVYQSSQDQPDEVVMPNSSLIRKRNVTLRIAIHTGLPPRVIEMINRGDGA